jgi:hypothetical protein
MSSQCTRTLRVTAYTITLHFKGKANLIFIHKKRLFVTMLQPACVNLRTISLCTVTETLFLQDLVRYRTLRSLRLPKRPVSD